MALAPPVILYPLSALWPVLVNNKISFEGITSTKKAWLPTNPSTWPRLHPPTFSSACLLCSQHQEETRSWPGPLPQIPYTANWGLASPGLFPLKIQLEKRKPNEPSSTTFFYAQRQKSVILEFKSQNLEEVSVTNTKLLLIHCEFITQPFALTTLWFLISNRNQNSPAQLSNSNAYTPLSSSGSSLFPLFLN
jgi:hypothetical protein